MKSKICLRGVMGLQMASAANRRSQCRCGHSSLVDCKMISLEMKGSVDSDS